MGSPVCLSISRNGSSRGGNIKKISRRGRCICESPRRIPFGLAFQTPRTGIRDRILNPRRSGPVVLREAFLHPPSPLHLPSFHLYPPLPCSNSTRAPGLATDLAFTLRAADFDLLPYPWIHSTPRPTSLDALILPSLPLVLDLPVDILFVRLYLVDTYSCCLYYWYIHKVLSTVY